MVREIEKGFNSKRRQSGDLLNRAEEEWAVLGKSMNVAEKEARLRKSIRDAAGEGRVVVAFSGGVDSSLLLWESAQALGPARVTAVTAVSPTSIP